MSIRPVLRIVHVIAGLVAFVTVAGFLIGTLRVELIGDATAIAAVKAWIVTRMPPLIVSFILVGGTGYALCAGNPKGLAALKLRRMKIIAPTGLFILVPAALFLNLKAHDGDFDALFYVVQAIEIMAGGLNLALLGMNMRDGFKMKGRFRAFLPGK